MKRNGLSFTTGLVTGMLVLTLGTTALAASGKVNFNFSHVALNGERRITAGQTITAPNGQQVPGTILYVDAAGGKTNYLPIRAISELLGTEISYDSATKTVLLGTAPAPQEDSSVWEKRLDGAAVIYQADPAAKAPDGTPSFRPTRLPDGWKLDRGEEDSVSSTWHYSKGSGHVIFSAVSPRQTQVVKRFSSSAVGRQGERLTVAGKPADLYTDRETMVLVWTDASGNLFSISSSEIDRSDLLAAAESVQPVAADGVSLQAAWMPEGYTLFERQLAGDAVSELWSRNGEILTVTAARTTLETPAGTAQTVTIGGRQGQYWERQDNTPSKGLSAGGAPVDGNSVTVAPGVTVTTNGQVGVHSKKASVLSWMRDGINFRLIAPPGVDRDTMLRIAENIR